ncbi:hypothetical protein EAS61_15105 [Bradyrhizobium zhanjiangense]|uniref:Uncharacterized protein n=1 Tax=Bradyrhizobium zhanjiangense TaxID=1325107 RepID=A0A4Q0QPZ4_9BRAD|nr:hypothetical protein EAS61_15105 [Bradyrhizobium zhanjiangense]
MGGDSAAVLFDDDAVLLLGPLASVADAVVHPGPPCSLPISEHAALGAMVALEALELGERVPMAPTSFLSGVIGEIVGELESFRPWSLWSTPPILRSRHLPSGFCAPLVLFN